MTRSNTQKRGFTLIELLVVIAIIGILASFTFVGMGAFLQRAKVARVTNTIRQIETSLVNYLTEHGSYPPAYGYLSKQAMKLSQTNRESLELSNIEHAAWFEREYYMNHLGIHGDLDNYDDFVLDTADTDYDGRTGRLEYYPPEGRNTKTVERHPADYGQPWSPQYPYAYSPTMEPDLDGEQRPLIYVPINLRQFRKVKKYWDANGGGFPDFHDSNNPLLNMQFPPATYDAFVLISAGPVGHTQGLIYDLLEGSDDRLDASLYPEAYYYHIAGLATYYMLTRDIDDDGQYDFDFQARKSNGEDEHLFPYSARTDRNGQQLPKRGPGVDGPIYRVTQ